jgi:hypothetical protein
MISGAVLWELLIEIGSRWAITRIEHEKLQPKWKRKAEGSQGFARLNELKSGGGRPGCENNLAGGWVSKRVVDESSQIDCISYMELVCAIKYKERRSFEDARRSRAVTD